MISEIVSAYEEVKEKIYAIATTWDDYLSEDTRVDPVLDVLDHLTTNKVGVEPDEEDRKAAVTEGLRRRKESIPPGFKDVDSPEPGDYLIWRELLDEARVRGVSDVLLVTGDVKEDWWRKEKGQRKGPRPELAAEMLKYCGASLLMVDPSSFLFHASKHLKVDIDSHSVQQVRNIELWPRIVFIQPIATRIEAFQEAVKNRDFRKAWDFVDVELKACWAQKWLMLNQGTLEQYGYARDQVLEDFLSDDPEDHQLWDEFAEGQLESLLQRRDVLDFQLGLTTQNLVAGIEVVNLFALEDGGKPVVRGPYPTFPVTMQNDGRFWNILNWGRAGVPTSGWPPAF